MPNSRDMLYLTYEELKPNILICTYFYLLKIFFLLYLTYEELKLINSFCYLGKLWPPVVPYLWGIETHSRVTLADLIVDSCTLPMRNWNNVSSHFSISCKRNKMLYLTYEELKRFVSSSIQYRRKMFGCTLPMRNWNLSNMVLPPHRYDWNVVPYLWGIETLYICGICNYLSFLLSCTLPMRNWNDESFVLLELALDIRCTLPMRNWNSCCIHHNSSYGSWYCCTLPMRNWNTISLSSNTPLKSISVVPYLWGIETTNWPTLIVAMMPSCTLPMRNWNLIPPIMLNIIQ